ncbi:class I SAM-dependent methyltransferase [Aquibium sp. A9E412]|uniref:class I SAM-dependent methyltransferase n=1 Tax=Aquibium sp. A9E412 TaxID=2976767 RepID=UPI0025B26850|nr:class I SAM-dependent methyltransferase [Aquibium sp. A9E412]MDN2566898.1 class I SAM-dependent methyltransferase [Aquibium sp. A9E412]
MAPRCRFCATPLATVMADLGATPVANAFLEPDAAAIAAERCYPLKVMVCHACFLAQTTETVPPEAIFTGDYAYLSSYSTSWLDHARRYAEAMTERFGLGPASQVVEIASNDGYLLQYFAARDIPVLGVEPAANAAAIAETRAVPTRVAFFDRAEAERLAAEGLSADLMAANNVLAHVPDIAGFVAGFAALLKPAGVATFEFPHLMRLIAGLQFDTIYHEHYAYLSLLAVERVFAAGGLAVFDVEELATHGGSLRVFAQRVGGPHAQTPTVTRLRAAEEAAGLADMATYSAFNARIASVCEGFRAFLAEARGAGRTLAAYGAAAKGNTFLNVCGVTRDDIAFAVDRNPVKQGRLLPGSHIPVRAPEALDASAPDFVVILPWNLAEEIRAANRTVETRGGRFVVAIPQTRLL